jgi:hypothetical protein
MRHATRIVFAALALAGAGACQDPGLFDRRLEFGPPVQLASGIAVLEENAGAVFHLEIDAAGATARRLFAAAEGADIAWLRAGPGDGDSLLLLTVPASERDTGVGEALVRLDAATGAAATYPVGAAFDGTAFGPDGRFLVLYHGAGGSGESFYNPSEIALLDLQAEPGEGNPLVFSVQLGGRTIEDVFFLPSLDVDGQERRLVAFAARGLVKLVDLLEPQAGTVSIKLAPDDTASNLLARQILARPGDGQRDPLLFVRAAGTNDIYAVSLVPRTDGQPGFWATLNMFDGVSPREMVLVEDGERPLLVVAAGNRAVVIDIDTADAFSLTLNGVADHTRLRGEPGAEEVVLYGTGTYRLHFLAVANLAAAKGGNLSGLAIPDGIDSAMALAGDRLLLGTFNGDLLILDLPARLLTRLAGAGYLDWERAAVFGDVFFLAETDSDRVITLDLGTGHPEPLVLDEPVQSLFVLAGPAMGLVLHPCPTGRATLFPLAEPTRDRAFVVDGFWLDGFLDETEVLP